MRISFNEIEPDAIPKQFLLNAGAEIFSNWSVQFDLNSFHRNRLINANKDLINLFVANSGSAIEGIFEITNKNYDTQFFGFKCYSVSTLFIAENLSLTKRQIIFEQFYFFLINFLKTEKVRFCSTSINSWNTPLSIEAQKIGFKYIVTWGDCICSKESTLQLPSEFYVGNTKNESDLPIIVKMAKDYFRGGRFYMDPMFKSYTIDKMYEDLIINSYQDPASQFSVLYNNKDVPIGCFIYKNISFNEVKVAALRFLVYDRTLSIKGLSTKFLAKTSGNLLKDVSLVTSGIELHNLASLKMHTDAGYKFNHVHAAYHLWL